MSDAKPAARAPPLEWEARYEVGIAVIAGQHREMPDIATRLADLDWTRIAADLDRWGAATTGPLLLQALLSQDMYLAGSFIMLLSILTVLGMLLSDILLAALDPRIRYE